jgi:hypothetical protein
MQMSDLHAPGLRLENLRHRTETGTEASVGTVSVNTAVPHMAVVAENYLFDHERRLFALRWFHSYCVRQNQRQRESACVKRILQTIHEFLATTKEMAVWQLNNVQAERTVTKPSIMTACSYNPREHWNSHA